MRLLYVHDLHFLLNNKKGDVYSQGGLTEEYFSKFLCAGYSQITVISRVKKLPGETDMSGFDSFNHPKLKLWDSGYSNYYQMFSFLRFCRVLSAIKRSELVVINTPSINGIFVGFLCYFFNKKYVCEVVGSSDAFNQKWGGKMFAPFIALSMKFLIGRACGATYVTQELKRSFYNKVSLVSSNVVLREFGSKKKLGGRKKFKVGFIGGINQRKGIEVIIRAAQIIEKGGTLDCHFYLVGDGDLSFWRNKILEAKVQEFITLLGPMNRSDINFFLRSLDIYIQPSFSEGVPRATIEAMSFGNPVVATDIPGFRELLSEKDLIEVGAEAALVDRLRFLLSNPAAYAKLSGEMLDISRDYNYSKLLEEKVKFFHRR